VIPSIDEFFAEISELQDRVSALERTTMPEYPRITGFDSDGVPRLLFDEERTASRKKFMQIQNRDLREGDRILLLNNIIMGTWTR